MIRSFQERVGVGAMLAGLLAVAGCGGGPAALGTEAHSLLFVDGPADHVFGGPIPSFRIWVLDAHDLRTTSLSGGSISLDLIDPSGAVQSGFATAPLSFGEARFSPPTQLAAGNGYTIRARFERVTADAPAFSVVAAPDAVETTNRPAGEVGFIVDGMNNIERLQDLTFTTAASHATVGVFNSGGLTQAVAVFAPDRRPELIPHSWTAGVDTLTIDLNPPVSIPVTVWVVTGTFATEQAQVTAALAQLNVEWRRERAGVEIGDVQFMDATALSEDFEFFALGIGAPFGPLQMGVGRAAGRFNIYVVSQIRVNQAFVSGFSEQPGTAMAIGSSNLVAEGARLLGHEFGHNFGLRDTNNIQGFLIDPNMMSTGSGSTALTEGQTLRAHFDRFSPLGAFRSGDTFGTLSCDPFEAGTHCPELGLRVWSESDPAVSAIPR